MASLEKEDEKILNTLISLGCCACCVIRYSHIPRVAVLTDAEKVLLSYGIPEEKLKRSAPCILCLDCLSPVAVKTTVIEKIIELLSKFDDDYYSIQLTIPTCLRMRERMLEIHMIEKFPDYYKHFEDFADRINACLKSSVVNGLRHFTNKLYKDEYPLVIRLIFEYQDDEKEMLNIVRLDAEKYLMRAQNPKLYHSKVVSKKEFMKTLKSLPPEILKLHLEFPPKPARATAVLSHIGVFRQNVVIVGYYHKYSRFAMNQNLSNTTEPTYIFTEMIRALATCFGTSSSEVLFSTIHDREDDTSRILGSGRPFIVSLKCNYRSKFNFQEVEEKLKEMLLKYGLVFKGLQMCEYLPNKQLLKLENSVSRKVELLCHINGYVNNVENVITTINNFKKPIFVQQKTNLAKLGKEEHIYCKKSPHQVISMRAWSLIGLHNVFILEIVSSPYLNEFDFVTGDFGRTNPSISCIIGLDVCVITSDDVTEYKPWPPTTSPKKSKSEMEEPETSNSNS